MKGKGIVTLLLAGTTVFSVAACGKTNGGQKIDPNKTQIYVHISNGGYGYSWLETAAEDWMKEAGNEKYEIIVNPSTDESPFNLEQNYNSGTADDVYFYSHCGIKGLIEKGIVADISDVMQMKPDGDKTVDELLRYPDTVKNAFSTADGKQYAIPYGDSFLGLVFDYQLFLDNGWLITDMNGELSVGKDGKAGTYDDGQPTNMTEWDEMIEKITQTTNAYPFIYTSLYLNYLDNVFTALFAQYEGMLTTHPYPRFTSYCQLEKLTEMRAAMHAAAETSYYRSIGNKPAMVEEIGNIGPMFTHDDLTPEYFEKALMTSYFAGSVGFLWWCAFDQNHNDFAPYDMQTWETQLGVAYADRTPKPTLKKLAELRKDIDEMGEMNVPNFDVVSIISNNVDHWAVAYGSYMLGAQSGYYVDYCFDTQPIKDSEYYILSVDDDAAGLPKYRAMELYERVRKGANLLITMDAGAIWDFEKMTGLRVVGNSLEAHVKTFTFNDKKIRIPCRNKLEVIAATAKVLATDEEGQIVVAEQTVGKGKVVFVNAPLETAYAKMHHPEKTDMYALYSYFLKDKKKAAYVDNRTCVTTEHDLGNGRVGVTFYNFDKENTSLDISIDGYEVERTYFAKVADGKIYFEKPYAYLILKS